jgi:hypothetical protein
MNAKHKRIVASLALIHIKILLIPVDKTRATNLGVLSCSLFRVALISIY